MITIQGPPGVVQNELDRLGSVVSVAAALPGCDFWMN